FFPLSMRIVINLASCTLPYLGSGRISRLATTRFLGIFNFHPVLVFQFNYYRGLTSFLAAWPRTWSDPAGDPLLLLYPRSLVQYDSALRVNPLRGHHELGLQNVPVNCALRPQCRR